MYILRHRLLGVSALTTLYVLALSGCDGSSITPLAAISGQVIVGGGNVFGVGIWLGKIGTGG